jgi:hypothetical protein
LQLDFFSGSLLREEKKREDATSVAAVIDKLDWQEGSLRLKWKSSKSSLIAQSFSQVRTFSVNSSTM